MNLLIMLITYHYAHLIILIRHFGQFLIIKWKYSFYHFYKK